MWCMISFLICIFFSVNSEVISLHNNDFSDIVKNNEGDVLWFIKFFAPWCGHCKRLAPILEKFSDSEYVLNSKSPRVLIGEVNCDEEKSLCNEYGITGYPSLLLLDENGDLLSEFMNERTPSEFERFIDHQQVVVDFDGVLKVLNDDNFDSEILYNNAFVVGCFCDDDTETSLVNFAPFFEGSRVHLSGVSFEDGDSSYLRASLGFDSSSCSSFGSSWKIIFKNRVYSTRKGTVVRDSSAVQELVEDISLDVEGKKSKEERQRIVHSLLEERVAEQPHIRHLKIVESNRRTKFWVLSLLIGMLVLFCFCLCLVIGLSIEEKWSERKQTQNPMKTQ